MMKDNEKEITFYLPDDLYEKLQTISRKMGRTQEDTIFELLQIAIKHQNLPDSADD